jgi:alpha-glucosidase
VHCIGRDQAFPDHVAPWSDLPHCVSNEHPSTHALIRGMRRLVDGYGGDRVLIGETALPGTGWVAPYYGDGDELHLAFNFAATHAPWDALSWRTRVERIEELLDPREAWPTWVLSNHDMPRHRTRHGGSEARARAAAVVLLTQRGTAFVYAGEELGLEDAEIPADRVVDPGGRDGCRAPLPWTASPDHGWPHDPWLPFPPDATARSVESQRADPSSVLHLYRRLLRARAASPALSVGNQVLLPAPEGVLAWRRDAPSGDARVVVVNMTTEPVLVDEAGTVEVASDGQGEGALFRGTLPGDTAVVLTP